MRPESAFHKFVHRLLAGKRAVRRDALFVLPDGRTAGADAVRGLQRSGALGGGEHECVANGETRSWLKRARLDADAFAAQHRLVESRPGAADVNLAESPLARLAASGGGAAPFLAPHHVEAGERVRRLVERAQLQPRLTMAYALSRTAGRQPAHAADITDMAAEARRELARLHAVLPRDCAGVVLDVCGLLKGLQQVESERGWPRRSAKLVLRIGLEQLAQHYGLGPFATGVASRRPHRWMESGARPERFE